MKRLIRVLSIAVAAAVVAMGVAVPLTPAGATGNPDGILISDAGGVLEFLDLETGEVTPFFHCFDEPGNYDIQYVGPFEIVLANFDHARIDRFDLRTQEMSTVVAGAPLSNPIGIAVSPKGVYYIADHAGQVFAYDVRSDSLELLADQGPGGEGFASPDGIVLDRQGRVVFTDHAGRVYRITPSDGSIELVATIEDAALNGVVLDHRGDLVVAAHDASGGPAGAVFRVDARTGGVTTLYEGLPFRDPEDVALDARGNIYVLDSDFQGSFGDHNPAVHLLRGGSGPPETLASASDGDPLFGGIVDILMTRPGQTKVGTGETDTCPGAGDSNVYDDPAEFQTAIAGFGTPTSIDFDDIDASPVNNTHVGREPFDGNTYAGQGITFGSPLGFPLYISPGGLFWNESNSLSVGQFPFDDNADDGNDDDLVVNLGPPASAVGFTLVDNGSQGSGEFIQFLDSEGDVVEQVGMPGDFQPFRAFIGIVSEDRPIAMIRVVEDVDDGDDVNYDDFVFVAP